MNLPLIIRAIRWMIYDTFRQSLATRLFWAMVILNLVIVVFCFSIKIRGDEMLPLAPGEIPMRLNLQKAIELGHEKALPFGMVIHPIGVEWLSEPLGRIIAKKEGLDIFDTKVSLGFGLIELPKSKDRVDAIRQIHVWLGGIVADTVGMFLVLIWTAGFLPSFLEPNHVTILLAKPTPRWALLLGKYLGVLFFVFLQSTIFVLGTWLALGLRSGVFDRLYLLTVPLLVIHFSIFYSFSVLLAVSTRNTVVCVLGSIVFFVLCWGLNYGRHAVVVLQIPGMSSVSKTMVEIAYWSLPKPGDMSLIVYDVLQADSFSMKIPEFHELQKQGKFQAELSLLSSFVFAAVMLLISAREFKKQDY